MPAPAKDQLCSSHKNHKMERIDTPRQSQLYPRLLTFIPETSPGLLHAVASLGRVSRKRLKFFAAAVICLFATNLAQGQYQYFHDDFEGYTSGDWLAATSSDWTTWSGSSGSGTDDVQVTDLDASSGSNSLYFGSGPGPEDVVLPFGAVVSSGYFLYSADFKVDNNSSAYFNFQGNQTPGIEWALEVTMNNNGTFTMSNLSSGTLLTGNYPQGSWFEWSFLINHTTNKWDVFINDSLVGTFSNPVNRVASLDLYPLNSLSSFWVDDVTFEVIPPSPNSASISGFTAPLSFCAGTNDVKVNVVNVGNNTLDSVRVYWELDGTPQTPVYVTTPIGVYNSSVSHELEVTLGSAFFGNTPRTIKAWTALPNGVADTINFDDTVSMVTGSPAIAGNYTIGGANADYADVSSAALALSQSGVCGPTTFHILPGTYNERVVIDEIQGASATNSVVFYGGGTDSVTITYSTSSNTDMSTVLLNGADYVTFRDMSIINTGTSTYGTAFQFSSGADHNTLEDCYLEVSPTATGYYMAVILAMAEPETFYSNGHSGDHNLIQNNEVVGGYYGIRWYGSYNRLSLANEFRNNELREQYYYGTYLYYMDSMKATANYIHDQRYSYAYGFVSYYSSHFEVTGNTIFGENYGAYLYRTNYYGYSGSGYSLFANNFVYSEGSNALRVYYSDHLRIANNSLYTNSDTYTEATVYVYDGSDLELINNVITAGHPTGSVGYFSNTSLSVLDANNYFAYTSPNFVYWEGSTITSLGAWQAVAPTYNERSYSSNPHFQNVASGDLHIDQSLQYPRGLSVDFTEDIDNDPRCAFAPTIGADESTYPVPKPTPNFLVPDTVFLNSPTAFYNAASAADASVHRWYLNGVLMSEDLHFTHTFRSTGQDTLQLVTENCGGMDSLQQIITVGLPALPPVASFLADKVEVESGETVNLLNLTSGGDTAWEWIITPRMAQSSFGFPLPTVTYLNGTDSSSHEPELIFDFPGTYDICLVATNSAGSDTFCMNDYIFVKATANMCFWPVETTVGAGTLYDDGGSTMDYGNGHTGINSCYYRIQPCAEDVTLEFSQFDLETNYDFLRVYDGKDASGTPLWDATSYPNGMTGNMSHPSFVDSMVAQSGILYVEFETDNYTTAPGFVAEWSSTPGNFSVPVVDFDYPDTVCVGVPVDFENISVGENINFGWDIFADGFSEGNGEAFSWTFNTAGTYDLKLVGENCGGVDSAIYPIYVETAQHAPAPGFDASLLRPNVGETVTLIDTSGYCRDSFNWQITPNTFLYVNGTNQYSQNPEVVFNQPGYYDVEQAVGNDFGSDSVFKDDYIFVINYCIPSVVTLNQDVGISKFVLGDITNDTEVGVEDYTDYASTHSTVLEKGGSYSATLTRDQAVNPMRRAIWIDYNQDGDFDDANELVASESSAFTLSWTGNFTVPSTAMEGATRLRVGTNLGSLQNRPCGPNQFGEYEDYRVVLVPDITAPEIALLGSDTVYLEQCRNYPYAALEPHVVATDNVDGNITSQVVMTGSYDSCMVGTYSFTYNVSDASGNMATPVSRTIIVVADTTEPVLTLQSPLIDTIEVYSSWTEPGYTATDNIGGNVTSSVIVTGMVDTSQVGMYVLTYTASDGANNITTATRVVHVVDQTAPTITLNGNAQETLALDSPYVELGVTAKDNYDLNLNVVTTGSVDIHAVGTYTLQYCVTDQYGNGPVCITREVTVVDTIAPNIALVGPQHVTLEVYSDYVEPGLNISDNYYQNFSIQTSGSWDGVADTLGTYTIVYTVMDGSSNIATITRTIEVVDRTKPTITLVDSPVIYIPRWTSFTDPGVVANDNYDSDPTIHFGGEVVDTSMLGEYMVEYWATDQSGNRSRTISRLVIVRPSAVGEGDLGDPMVKLYPNPNQGSFTVELELPQRERVRISVVNSVGQEVVLIEEGQISAGTYPVNLQEASNGMYFLKIQTEGEVTMKKFVIAR